MNKDTDIELLLFLQKKNGILEKSIKSLNSKGLNTWDLLEEIDENKILIKELMIKKMGIKTNKKILIK